MPGRAAINETAWVFRMQKPLPVTSEPQITLLGEHHPLVQQLGSVEGLHELARVSHHLRGAPVTDSASLRSFLHAYQSRILMPIELHIIHQSYLHAAGHRTQELIDLDERVGSVEALQQFLQSSRRVGQNELRRLRPLRDVRVLQRYLAAVDSGHAEGWHTCVFGLTLAIYSVPLRQGLLGYAQQVMRGFIHMAGTRFSISAAEIEDLMEDLNAALPAALGSLLFLECLNRRPR